MISFSLTAAVVLLVVVAIVAAAGLAVAGTTAGRFITANRQVRLARHESMRRYYGGMILSH